MSNQSTYLKITKSDGTVHFVPFSAQAQARYEKSNTRLTDKMKIETVTQEQMDADIAAKRILDPSFRKSKQDLLAENKSKDDEIAKLKEQLAAKSAPVATAVVANENADAENAAASGTGTGTTAADLIEKINSAESVEQVDALIEGESRKTVLNAAEKKKAELTK